MPDIPAPDAHDARGPFVANLRYLLDNPEFYPAALASALDFGETAARAAWEGAKDRPPTERLLLSLLAAAEAIEGLALKLAGDQGGEVGGE